MGTRFSEMTEAERLAWGLAELLARKDDLSVNVPGALAQAQANARTRRLAVGASRQQASRAVIEANRAADYAVRALAEAKR